MPPRKTRIQADTPAITGFAAYVERFKSENPEEWDELRLCPLQHGIEVMVDRLK